jgi:hypothetical protein
VPFLLAVVMEIHRRRAWRWVFWAWAIGYRQMAAAWLHLAGNAEFTDNLEACRVGEKPPKLA